eukprot:GHVQ01005143.1.p1 GENE.GHVQ01005143.1~~GHVQ01005143.1.p1  ORF type:complete len:447 (-),score=100.12 GHVQ01005143.1:72-1412(-)
MTLVSGKFDVDTINTSNNSNMHKEYSSLHNIPPVASSQASPGGSTALACPPQSSPPIPAIPSASNCSETWHKKPPPDEEKEDNPFSLPPDEELFSLRERERQERLQDRKAQGQLPVWHKTTACSRMRRICRESWNDEDEVGGGETDHEPVRGSGSGPGAAAAAAGGGRGSGSANSAIVDNSSYLGSLTGFSGQGYCEPAGKQKENLRDFVQKKREMFLVQMALDVKKTEIIKLHEKAALKEEALKKSQQMLEEDVARFDTFLHANDAKAHKAMKQAEDLMKTKQEKALKIKQLKGQIAAVQSEISKHREQKEECIKFKNFLDNLTPKEWDQQQMQEKQNRKNKRKEKWVESRWEEVSWQIARESEELDREVARELQHHEDTKRKNAKQYEEVKRELEDKAERKKRGIRRRYPAHSEIEKEYQEESRLLEGTEESVCFFLCWSISDV